jgi:uncharacterized membrane protein
LLAELKKYISTEFARQNRSIFTIFLVPAIYSKLLAGASLYYFLA